MTERPDRDAVQWIGDARPDELRVGDWWNGRLVTAITDGGASILTGNPPAKRPPDRWYLRSRRL